MRQVLAGISAGLMVAAAMVVPATAAADDGASARAGEYIKITTASAVAYGDAYPGLDGTPEAFVFRPRFPATTEVRCPAGVRAAVYFGPITAHQGPSLGDFTCTGSPQDVAILPASPPEAGSVKVDARLIVNTDTWPATEVAATSRTVRVTDVRTSWARLTGPETVTRNRTMELSSTIQRFTQGAWKPLSTRVAVQSSSNGGWTTVGETITGKNGKLRFTTPPVARSADWRLTWSEGGQAWYSNHIPVKVTEPPVLPVAPPFWVGKVTKTTADVHWSAPKGATNITGYRFGWTSSNGKPVKSWQDDWPANARSPLTMINLHPGTTYTMWVRAITPQGLGKKATVKVTTKPAVRVVVPTAPRNLKATAGKRQVVVRWSAPARSGGAPVKSYQVRLTSAGVKQHQTVPAKRVSLTVKGLKKGKAYSVTTRARNSAGWSTWAKAKTVRVR